MLYEFKCCGIFEVNQAICAEHRAQCPECGKEAQRIFSKPQWIWKGDTYKPDGLRREAANVR